MRAIIRIRNVVVVVTALSTWTACGASDATRPVSPSSSSATERQPTSIPAWDTDNDSTVDWAETKAAALAKFERLDTDHDGTIDAKELQAANIDKTALDRGDADHDGTLDKEEYVALVHEAFRAADADNDGRVSASELGASKGRALSTLVE
jgi:hypothetical protein